MKEERLKELLDKYYCGMSSEAEEDELKVYFSGEEVIEGYETERKIFTHYFKSGTIPVPSGDFEDRIIKAVDELEKTQYSSPARKVYILIMSAAAAVILLTGTYFIFFSREKQEDTFTDPQVAYAETMRILYEVSSKLNKGEQALKPITRIRNLSEGMSSAERSAEIISKNLQRIKLLEETSDKGGKIKTDINKIQ